MIFLTDTNTLVLVNSICLSLLIHQFLTKTDSYRYPIYSILKILTLPIPILTIEWHTVTDFLLRRNNIPVPTLYSLLKPIITDTNFTPFSGRSVQNLAQAHS